MATALALLSMASALAGAGYYAGMRSEGNRWADNAKRVWRIEWRGRLYKVSLDE